MYDVVNRVSVTYLIHLMHDYEKSLCYIKLYVYNLHHINYIKKNTILFLGLATIWDLKQICKLWGWKKNYITAPRV